MSHCQHRFLGFRSPHGELHPRLRYGLPTAGGKTARHNRLSNREPKLHLQRRPTRWMPAAGSRMHDRPEVLSNIRCHPHSGVPAVAPMLVGQGKAVSGDLGTPYELRTIDAQERAADGVERVVVFTLSSTGEVQGERVAVQPLGGKSGKKHVIAPRQRAPFSARTKRQ